MLLKSGNLYSFLSQKPGRQITRSVVDALARFEAKDGQLIDPEWVTDVQCASEDELEQVIYDRS